MKYTTLFTALLLMLGGSLSAQVDTLIYGCTNPLAANYNPEANVDDGSCNGFLGDNDFCNNRHGVSEGLNYFDNSQATVSQGWPAECWGGDEEASLWFEFITPPYPSSVLLEIVADSAQAIVNSQMAIASEGCTGNYLYCDASSGEGEQAGFFFECGELPQNTAFMFVVNSSYANAGDGYISLSFDGACGDSLIYGCMDPAALNYNPFVNVDDGSCFYWADSLALFGCIDPLALNFDSLAIYEDGSCIYDNDSTDIYGCTDYWALNYNPSATIDDGTCYYDIDSTDVYGCTDYMALNFNPLATIDDGSCTYDNDTTQYYGCIDSYALNFDPFAIIDDGSCLYSDSLGGGYGCTDPIALNYNPEATNEDYSCEYAVCEASFEIIQIDQENNMVYIVNNSTAMGSIDYLWDFGDGNTSTEAYPEYTYSENGSYMICLSIVDSAYGCWNTQCDTISFFGFTGGGGEEGVINSGFTVNIQDPQALSVEELDFIDRLTVYPNPTQGEAQLRFNSLQAQDLSIAVTDAMGRQVWNKVMYVPQGESNLLLNLVELGEGVYLIAIRSQDEIMTRSLLIAK